MGQPGDLLDPVHRLHQDRVGQFPSQSGVEADRLGPPTNDVHAAGQLRGVKADLDRDRVENRTEHRTAAHFVFTFGCLGCCDLFAVQLKPGELLGRSGDHHRATAVTDGQHRGFHRADVLGELPEQFGDSLGFGVGHRHHRRPFAKGDYATSSCHQRAGRTE